MAVYKTSCADRAQVTTAACGTIKCHRVGAQTSVTTSAWTDCSNFTEIADETQGDVAELDADNKTINILVDGIYQFGGCVHVNNPTGSIFSGLIILTRLVQNGVEMRCSQRGKVVNIAAGGEEVISYNGTAALSAGDEVKLQYYTDEADVDFESNANFDNQVAYTIWLIRCGGAL